MQRITRYPLLLREAVKNFDRAGFKKCVETIREAYKLTMEISKYSDDMMEAGRIKNLDDSLQVRIFEKYTFIFSFWKIRASFKNWFFTDQQIWTAWNERSC